MSDIELAEVATPADLAACVNLLYVRADSPSYRDLEKLTDCPSGVLPGTGLRRVRLSRSAIGELLRGLTFPKKAFLLTFVEACGIDVAADRRWAEAWDRLSERYAKRAGQAQTELAELRAEVDKLHAEMEAQAEEADRRAEAIRLAAKADMEKAQAEKDDLRAEVSRLNTELVKGQLAVDGLRAEETELRAEVGRFQAKVKAQAEKADRRAEAIKLHADAAAEKARTEAAGLRADVDGLQAKVAEEQLASEKAQAEVSELRAQLATATKDAEKGRLEALHLLELTQRRLSASQDEITQLRKKASQPAEKPEAKGQRGRHSLAPADADSPVHRDASAGRALPPEQQASKALPLPHPPVDRAFLSERHADQSALPGPADPVMANKPALDQSAPREPGASVSLSMPQLGESVTEGTVTRWLKKEGERVEADEPLLEVSTDKVDTEIPSPASGILRGIAVGEDKTVAVGAQLAVIELVPDQPTPPRPAEPVSADTPSLDWPRGWYGEEDKPRKRRFPWRTGPQHLKPVDRDD